MCRSIDRWRAREIGDVQMTRPNPAAEPSMDEILASIRKIIAEDPVGASGGAEVASQRPSPAAPPASVGPAGESNEFELPSVFKAKPAAERGGSLFGRLAGVAPAASTPAALQANHTAGADLSDLVENDLGDLLADSEAGRSAEPPAAAATSVPLPPPAPGLSSGAGALLPIAELLKSEPDAVQTSPVVAPATPTRSEEPTEIRRSNRLGDRLPPMQPATALELGSDAARLPGPQPTAPSRDDAIASALGALVPTRSEHSAGSGRLPPLGGASASSPFSSFRPGAPANQAASTPSVPSPLAADSKPVPAKPTVAPERTATSAADEPVVLAAMPSHKPLPEPAKAVAPPVAPPAAPAALTAAAPSVEPVTPPGATAGIKPQVLAAMPARKSEPMKPAEPARASEIFKTTAPAAPATPTAPSIADKRDMSRSQPEVLAAMPAAKPTETLDKPSEAKAAPVVIARTGIALPPLKPAVSPAAPAAAAPAAVGESLPAATPSAGSASSLAGSPAEPTVPLPAELTEQSTAAAASALGALAAGLAKSSVSPESPEAIADVAAPPTDAAPTVKVEPKPAQAASGPAAAPSLQAAPASVAAPVTAPKESAPAAAAPQPAAAAPAPAQPPVEPPVVRAAQVTIAPIRPQLPKTPVFVAPAPTAPRPVAPEPVQAEPAPAAATAIPMAAAEPTVDALAMLSAAMASKPSAIAPTPQTAAAAAEGKGASADAETTPERTLEDTVAELLRPMLRQWLSDNMPRIVEKALRIELAQGLKSGGKPRT